MIELSHHYNALHEIELLIYISTAFFIKGKLRHAEFYISLFLFEFEFVKFLYHSLSLHI